MIYPPVRELARCEQSGGISARSWVSGFDHAKAAYCWWLVGPVSEVQMLHAHKANALVDARGDGAPGVTCEYGYRLRAGRGRN